MGPNAKMIPGHGHLATAADVLKVRQYFTDLRGAVGRESRAGKTREEAVESAGAVQDECGNHLRRNEGSIGGCSVSDREILDRGHGASR